MKLFKNKKQKYIEIDPDEIFLDSRNLPSFDKHQFEGRIEKPIGVFPFWGIGAFFFLVLVVFGGQLIDLQILSRSSYIHASENNSIRESVVFNERGVIFDRVGEILAYNTKDADDGVDFLLRRYADSPGNAHVLGFVNYPAKDKSGYFYQKEFIGKGGVEEFYDETLAGVYGLKITEIDVSGRTQSESVFRHPRDGENITLSIDSRFNEALYSFIKNISRDVGFTGGSAVFMDVSNGEIIALTSFPEYDSNVLTEGADEDGIERFVNDPRKPFLNRAISGLYIPGSIVKPFIAIAALNEKIISSEKKILSTGAISIPNLYRPGEESVFRDWKAHGLVDMRRALAQSSNVYFYEISGGYGNQKGLGIGKIEQYMRLFGFGKKTGIDLFGEMEGTIPSPAWKKEVFADEWRIGDTYNTAIGQYGFQVTPIQAVRAIGAIANDGILRTPHVLLRKESKSGEQDRRIRIPSEYFEEVKKGLREAVLSGTAQALYLPHVSIAAKTGTAEIGISKDRVNSWVIGFFPYENPRYAFAVVLEGGRRENLIGAPFVMREMFQWMAAETPEYLK